MEKINSSSLANSYSAKSKDNTRKRVISYFRKQDRTFLKSVE